MCAGVNIAECRSDGAASPERGRGALPGGGGGWKAGGEKDGGRGEEKYLITHEFNKHGNEGGNSTLAFLRMSFCMVKCLFSSL